MKTTLKKLSRYIAVVIAITLIFI
uniref:PrgQ n=1 Tax=Enterococcus faecalis TaxID=1351 RepID=Q52202_ENTFL|nr:PrgQ [Enterococcus faecalis]ARF06187.1 PrgQ [Cloning vector pCIE]BAH02410.1 PrgQ [Enterococcus faecalis]